MSKIWKLTLFALFLVTITVWLATFQNQNSKFRLITCDVGQGDAILAIYGSTQLLIDGGPNRKVIECLSRHLPFWDRQLEAVIMTHPEKDHYEGLIDVFDSYKVVNILTSGLDSGNQSFEVLESKVGSEGVQVHNVREGQKLRLGMIHLDILHPSEKYVLQNSDNNNLSRIDSKSDVLGTFTTSKNKNDFSVVAVLSFGEFDALLTGDIEDAVSDQIASQLTTHNSQPIEYIKIPHHGSKNGLSQKLIDAVNPKVAVISSGKNNSYGHPHQEVVRILNEKDIEILRTDVSADVVVESDGSTFWLLK